MDAGDMTLSCMVLAFMEGAASSSTRDDVDDDEQDDAGAEGRAFWESQLQQLQEALGRPSSIEWRLAKETALAAEEVRSSSSAMRPCSCPKSETRSDGRCRRCTLCGVAQRLRDAGHDSAFCKSKWTRSQDIPSGEHCYVDVLTAARDGRPVRVVIELNFRAEFEMARASAEYGALVRQLPEVFVGKAERLKLVLKIMCAAAKRCIKENNMYMGPWRKHKYMQAKWLATPERGAPAPASTGVPPPPAAVSGRPSKARASMLTFDLHRTAVAVV